MSRLSPREQYRQDLEREGFQHDSSQEKAVEHLQRLYEALTSRPRPKPATAAADNGIKSKMSGFFGKKSAPSAPSAPAEPDIKGLYFWGGVGRGKTWLVDTFHDSLPFDDKMRTHFHRFMQRVHKELEIHKGQKNPLTQVAVKLAGEARVICLDEFFVKDITDAMILGNLLDALFAQGVVLVTTSNIVPDELYKNGLQRDRFLPAIDLLNRHCEVVNVDAGIDYRMRTLTREEVFHTPAGDSADEALQESFAHLAGEPGEEETLRINGRALKARRCHEGVVWFDFKTLCDGPRSQNDYIELSRQYHSVLISNVPVMGAAIEDQARRFINLVDEFYDRAVKLVMSAEAEPESLYSGGELAFEFERTVSRLQEMQSSDYLALTHKP
ncbi:cell division protein ZapE [Kushneria marisflavi]|uniref:Cell division protein ZapE n=1 Tax=Kushneria marisflavi TaxID=157779 RepID=A0A240UTC1_9GAMM|nr:cell division protein ZapE [Kushneria marisflavi]ART64260.1 cell division protein ZapE [Kushneria marisflavi]RKD76723.1 cell division protein ZapE [Kushneria marisflavi]